MSGNQIFAILATMVCCSFYVGFWLRCVCGLLVEINEKIPHIASGSLIDLADQMGDDDDPADSWKRNI